MKKYNLNFDSDKKPRNSFFEEKRSLEEKKTILITDEKQIITENKFLYGRENK